MTVVAPLPMAPVLHARPWGGRRLAARVAAGTAVPAGPLGESWEVADLPPTVAGGRTAVASGPHAGRTLHELLARDRGWLLGRAAPSDEGGFPLLVKYLDAHEHLSVQVHPTEAYAASHPGARVKHESWLVLEAEPGAVIYAGFRRRVDADEVRRRAMDGTLPEILRTIPATAGAWLHLPSGTCHALGAGILVAEVQSPSDTTFRIFDWGRGGRALHLEPALACIDFSDEGPQPTDGVLLEAGPFRTRRLGRTAGFALELIGWTQDAELDLEGTDAPEVLLNLGPAGSIETSDGAADPVELPLDEGRTVVIPAAARRLRIRLPAGGRMLRVHGGVPEPERIA